MKRFRRWLFNSITVLSLISCLLIAALCVRSYSFSDTAVFRIRRVHDATITDIKFQILSGEGRCGLEWLLINWQLPQTVNRQLVPAPYGGFFHIDSGRNSDLRGLVSWRQDTLLHTIGFGCWTHQLSLVMPVTEGELSPTETQELGGASFRRNKIVCVFGPFMGIWGANTLDCYCICVAAERPIHVMVSAAHSPGS